MNMVKSEKLAMSLLDASVKAATNGSSGNRWTVFYDPHAMKFFAAADSSRGEMVYLGHIPTILSFGDPSDWLGEECEESPSEATWLDYLSEALMFNGEVTPLCDDYPIFAWGRDVYDEKDPICSLLYIRDATLVGLRDVDEVGERFMSVEVADLGFTRLSGEVYYDPNEDAYMWADNGDVTRIGHTPNGVLTVLEQAEKDEESEDE